MDFTIVETVNQVPTSIGSIKIDLIEVKDRFTGSLNRLVFYNVEVFDQNGNLMDVSKNSGDLIPYLTDVQKNWLIQFIIDMRTKAETELLP